MSTEQVSSNFLRVFLSLCAFLRSSDERLRLWLQIRYVGTFWMNETSQIPCCDGESQPAVPRCGFVGFPELKFHETDTQSFLPYGCVLFYPFTNLNILKSVCVSSAALESQVFEVLVGG